MLSCEIVLLVVRALSIPFASVVKFDIYSEIRCWAKQFELSSVAWHWISIPPPMCILI